MKILMAGDNDLIGRRFNGFDLHRSLRKRGVKADLLVQNKQSDDPDTYLYRVYDGESTFSKNLFFEPLWQECDLLHIHLLHNTFFDWNYLPLLSRIKPCIMTLHDPWIFSGHCIHHGDCEKWKTGCGDCPSLEIPFPIPFDSSALNFELKNNAVRNSEISFIAASKWMKEKAETSPVLEGKKIHFLPFGIDQTIFHPGDKRESRTNLGVDPDSKVIFTLSHKGSPFKGHEIKHAALEHVRKNYSGKVTLITIGFPGDFSSMQSKNFKVLEFKQSSDPEFMAGLYRACDIFLMPSRNEAFGLMAVETMSCGGMVLSIPGTSLESVTNAPVCGVSVPEKDYPEELLRLLNHPEEMRMRGKKSLEYARVHYELNTYLQGMIDIYREQISNHKRDERAQKILDQLKKYSPPPNEEHRLFQQEYPAQKWLSEGTLILKEVKQMETDLEILRERYSDLLNTFPVRWANRIKRLFGKEPYR